MKYIVILLFVFVTNDFSFIKVFALD